MNAAEGIARNCTFTDMTRRAVVYLRNATSGSTFTAEDCLFARNLCAFAPVSGDTYSKNNEGGGGVKATVTLNRTRFVATRDACSNASFRPADPRRAARLGTRD